MKIRIRSNQQRKKGRKEESNNENVKHVDKKQSTNEKSICVCSFFTQIKIKEKVEDKDKKQSTKDKKEVKKKAITKMLSMCISLFVYVLLNPNKITEKVENKNKKQSTKEKKVKKKAISKM